MKLISIFLFSRIFIASQKKVPKSIMIDYDATLGMILFGDHVTVINDYMPELKKLNPKIRFLLLLNDEFSREILRKTFEVAFQQFGISDVFIVFAYDFKKFFEPFSVYAFNTFEAGDITDRIIEINFSFDFAPGIEDLREIVENRYKNLGGYVLRVVLFKFMMVCEGTQFKNGSFDISTLKYQDAELLKILAKSANFSIKFVTSADGVNHGYQTSNFTFTGSLGMVEYEKADFAANARLLAEYNTSNTLNLFPTVPMSLKFMVPRKYATDVNILVGLYNFLDDGLKISILAMFIVIPAFVYALDSQGTSNTFSTEALIRTYLMFYSIMTFVSVKLPLRWSSRHVTGAVVIVWLIIGNTYAGKMIEFLNTNFGLKQIGSIQEIVESSMEVKIPYPFAILFEGNFENSTESHLFMNKIANKGRELESRGDRMAFIDVENMAEMIRSRKYALMFLDNLIGFLEKSFYDESGNDILTHIDETPYQYYYASSVPKTSPFVQRFNEIAMFVFEAGIPKYQRSLAEGDTDLIYIRRIMKNPPDSGAKPMSLKQFASIFYLLVYGLVACSIVFFVEVLIEKIRKSLRKLEHTFWAIIA